MKIRTLVNKNTWLWACMASLLLWLTIGVVSGNLSFESLISITTSASFLIVPAIGQMLVITSGRGSIDLSIPGMITLSAFLTTGIINGENVNIFHGLAVILAAGATVGFFNSLLVLKVRIPPIIATLGMGYILTTAILFYNRDFAVFKTAPFFLTLTRGRLFSIPYVVYLVIILIALVSYVLKSTKYGRSLIATGQNIDAAKMAGVNVFKIQVMTYIFSGMLAALAGAFLSARVGGAFLGMGDPYLLETVGSVVVGGTPIFGGKATPTGTFFGGLFLVLLVTVLQIAGYQIGTQYMIKGFLLLLVVVIASNSMQNE